MMVAVFRALLWRWIGLWRMLKRVTEVMESLSIC